MHRPSGTPALHAAQAAGLEYALVEVQHSEHQEGGYALDTARVLERDPSTIFKTLMAKVDGDPVCAVVPASGMLNLKALARAVGGKKACMMQAQDAERLRDQYDDLLDDEICRTDMLLDMIERFWFLAEQNGSRYAAAQ